MSQSLVGIRCVYVGPGAGQGEIHTVISHHGDEIITWGDEGHSWLGTLNMFFAQFRLP